MNRGYTFPDPTKLSGKNLVQTYISCRQFPIFCLPRNTWPFGDTILTDRLVANSISQKYKFILIVFLLNFFIIGLLDSILAGIDNFFGPLIYFFMIVSCKMNCNVICIQNPIIKDVISPDFCLTQLRTSDYIHVTLKMNRYIFVFFNGLSWSGSKTYETATKKGLLTFLIEGQLLHSTKIFVAIVVSTIPVALSPLPLFFNVLRNAIFPSLKSLLISTIQ